MPTMTVRLDREKRDLRGCPALGLGIGVSGDVLKGRSLIKHKMVSRQLPHWRETRVRTELLRVIYG